MTAHRHPRAAFLPKLLPPVEGTTVQLSSLVRFLEHPVKAFLRERLGFYADDLAEQLSDALPIELGPLERWALGDRLLETRLAGASSERALAAERGRGLLPPGPLGDAALAEVEGVVEALVAAFEVLPSSKAPAATVEVNIALPDGFSLVGTVPGAHEGTILRCTYSKLRPKHRLRAWAQFLALSAAHPDLLASAVTIGQGEGSTTSRPRIGVSTLGPLLPDEGGTRAQAIEWLQVLVDLYRRGMREPLPIYCATSAAWAAASSPGSTQVPDEAARARWASNWEEFPGEGSDPEHVAVLGPEFPFEHLVELLPRPDEEGQGWAMDEPSRLGRLAMRLWGAIAEPRTPPGALSTRMQTGPRHFDVCGPLPGPGVTILEASAGTGKTFTIAALVARLVAEGVPLSDILVVTFTRMATGELRDRVRERLVSAEAGLSRYLDRGNPLPADDPVVELLAEGGHLATSERRRRLADALGSFDTATITTTHGFCHMVLAALGVWGEVADGATLLEDQRDVVEDVVDDLLVRHALRSAIPPFGRKVALEIAFKAVDNPGTPLDPEPDMQDSSPPGLRRRLAEGVRRELKERLLDANLLTYDGLLDRLLAALNGRKARRDGPPPVARTLPSGARGRVPRHGLRPVEGGPKGLFGRDNTARTDRRPEAGRLFVPRGRRLCLPRGRAGGRAGAAFHA